MSAADPSFGCRYAPQGDTHTLTAQPPPFIDPSLWQKLIDKRTTPVITDLPPGISLDQVIAPYLLFKILIRYRWKNGIIQIPVAKPPATLQPITDVTGNDIIDLLGKRVTPSPGSAPGLPPTGLSGQIGSNNGGSTSTSVGSPLSPQYGGSGGPPAATPVSSGSDVQVRPSSKIIQTSAPYGQKIVTFTIVRQGMQVALPDPTPANDNETLISAETDLYSPQPMPDGQTFVWAAAGTYIYALTQPYWITDGLVCGTTPADNLVTDSTLYGSFNVDDELV